jgi:hypothetical protein
VGGKGQWEENIMGRGEGDTLSVTGC